MTHHALPTIPATRRPSKAEHGICPGCCSLTETADPSCAECLTGRPAIGWGRVEDEVDPWLGQVLDERYLVAQRLGVGGTARVYRVEALDLPRRFALKIVDLDAVYQGRPDEGEERVRREIEVVRKLRSPHVVPIYDVMRPSSRTIGMLMGFAEGETLQHLVARRGPMSVSDALKVVEQVASGLAAAHRLGIVHRDVKPENIMVQGGDSGQVFARLMDFGIAHVAGQSGLTRGFIGSPMYASPEQATEDEIGPATDVYSLGATLYYMLTGSPPFTRRSTMALIRAHVIDPVPRLADAEGDVFEAALERLVMRMLSKDPEERPLSMSALVAELFALRAIPGWEVVTRNRLHNTSEIIGLSETISEQNSDASTGSHALCMAPFAVSGRFERAAPMTMAAGRVATILDRDVVVTILSPRMTQRHRVDFAETASCLAVSNARVLVGTLNGRVHCDENPSWPELFRVPQDAVVALAVSPNDEATAVGTRSGRVYLRVRGGQWGLVHHGSPVRALALSSTGEDLAVATWDRVCVLNVPSMLEVTIDQPDVSSMSFSGDGYLLATADRSGRAAVWTMTVGAPRRTHTVQRSAEEVLAVHFAHDTLLGLCRGEDGTFLVDLQCQFSHSCVPSCTRCHER